MISEWPGDFVGTRIVYAKPPFAGPKAVLAYLSRYTHRVAISNRRLVAMDETSVTFRVKDYRREGAKPHRTLTLEAGEFIRRFLVHVLPKGFHRIRHYGLLAGADRKAKIERAREMIAREKPSPAASTNSDPEDPAKPCEREPSKPRDLPPCPCCGGRMRRVAILPSLARARAPPFKCKPNGRSPS